MRTAACYIRVSTDDQLEYSPDSQLKIIRAYALKQDLQLPKAYIFREDDGVSGRKADNRPAFQQMIAAAKQSPPPFEVILVWKFSRFARNQEESIVYKSLLQRRGVEVVSVSEPLTEGPYSSLMERIIEWMDEYYSTNLGSEVKRGMRERLSRGLAVSAAPYGYAWKEGRLVVDAKAAQVVYGLFERFAAGETILQLTRWANTLDTGRIWENRAITYLLKNPVYIGKLRSWARGRGSTPADQPEEIFQGQHQAILPQALWDQAQYQFTRRQLVYRRHDHTANAKPRLFSGLLRCSTCGGTLASGGKKDSWQCTGYTHGKCSVSHYTTTRAVAAVILPAIRQNFGEDGVKLLFLQPEDAHSENTVLAKRQLEQAEARLQRARDAYEAGVYTLAEYQQRRIQLQSDKEAAQTCLQLGKGAHKPAQSGSFFLTKGYLEILLDVQTDMAERNDILKKMVKKIVFDRAHNRFDIFYYL